MNDLKAMKIVSGPLILTFVLSACGFSTVQATPTPTPTDTSAPIPTVTLTPMTIIIPSPTPSPTIMPDLAATEENETFNTEAQKYYELGYLGASEGITLEIDDFYYEWAQLGSYSWLPLHLDVSNFYISAHFAWDSAYRNADSSGCGVAFAIQPNREHYSVFLDRTRIVFLDADNRFSSSRNVSKTRGSRSLKFETPAEADFTLIVKRAYAYVLVDGELIGEYTLTQSRNLRGDIGLSILSGTNKDYGTKCEMTHIHIFIPN